MLAQNAGSSRGTVATYVLNCVSTSIYWREDCFRKISRVWALKTSAITFCWSSFNLIIAKIFWYIAIVIGTLYFFLNNAAKLIGTIYYKIHCIPGHDIIRMYIIG